MPTQCTESGRESLYTTTMAYAAVPSSSADAAPHNPELYITSRLELGQIREKNGDYVALRIMFQGSRRSGISELVPSSAESIDLEQPPIDCSKARKSRSTGDGSFEPRHAHSCRQALGHSDTGNRRLP